VADSTVDDVLDFLDQSNSKNDRETVNDRDINKPKKFGNPVLKAKERKRFFNIGTVLAEAFFKVKDEEKEDTYGETAVGTPAEKAKAAAEAAEQKGKKPFKLPLLATLAIGITAFATWLADFLGPVGEFITKTLPKIFKPMVKWAGGFFKGLKAGGGLMKILGGIAGKIGKRILKFGRFIPVIGSLFSFGFGISRWKKGEYIPAIFEFLSGILNLLPTGVGNAISILIDGGLLLYDLNKETGDKEKVIEPEGSGESIWDKIYNWAMETPVISNIMSLGKGWAAVFKGEWSEAAKHFDRALPWVGAVIGWIAEAGKATGRWLEDRGIKLGSPGEFFGSIVDKFVSVFTNMIESIYEWIKGAADWIVDGVKNIGSGIWEGIKSGVKKVVPFNDVIKSGNKVYPIHQEDDFIAAKKGGALDKLFASVGGNMSNLQRRDRQRQRVLERVYKTMDSHIKNMQKQQTNQQSLIVRLGSQFEKDMKQTAERVKAEEGIIGKLKAFGGGVLSGLYKVVSGGIQDVLGVDEVVDAIKTSNLYLSQLVQLTSQLVAGQGQQPPPVYVNAGGGENNDMSGGMQGARYPDGRYDFTNSAYSIG
tara:strand:+ start:10329 stop:12101 length:1773 start_codon:yes stop_codon:yes gene_type:complete